MNVRRFARQHPGKATLIVISGMTVAAYAHGKITEANQFRVAEPTVISSAPVTGNPLADDAYQLISSGNPLATVYGQMLAAQDREENYYQ